MSVGCALLATTLALSSARADAIEGPALTAWYPRYNGEHPELTTHGSGCLNRADEMPPGRESDCGKPALRELGAGRYAVTTENAAPFPEIADDSGYLVFVATVGSNAHCFEEGVLIADSSFESAVRCVDPGSGSAVESDFSWSYRADSTEHPQEGDYLPNFAYARVTPAGAVVPSESFNPLNLRAEDVLAERTAPGRYRVTFRDLNPIDSSLEPELAPYNVVVQKTCLDDDAGGAAVGGCYRAVCSVGGWVPGDFTTYDTTVEVSCSDAEGAPRDTGFRVFFGDEGFTSQGGFDGGYRFGWLNWSLDAAAAGCHTQPDVPGSSQHETPPATFLGYPVEACHPDVGLYEVNFFQGYVAPYSYDGMQPVVTTLSASDRYCNVARVLCPSNSGTCSLPESPENTRVTVACFDRAGSPADAAWLFNMVY